MLHERTGDLDAAMSMSVQLRQQSRSILALSEFEPARIEATFAMNIAHIEHRRGRTPAAIAILRKVLPELHHLPDITMRIDTVACLCGLLVAVDDLGAAVEAAREVIAMQAQHEPDAPVIANVIEQLALVCALRDDVSQAAILAGYSDAALARAGATRDSADQTNYDRLRTVLREKLGPADIDRLLAEGAVLIPKAAIASALTVSVL